jgi:hypothetical protein
MRAIQIFLFMLGAGCLLLAGVTAGSMVGVICWQAGIAILLVDLVAIQLWPSRPDWTRPGHCVYCGYDLKGAVEGRCAECGKDSAWKSQSDPKVG